MSWLEIYNIIGLDKVEIAFVITISIWVVVVAVVSSIIREDRINDRDD